MIVLTLVLAPSRQAFCCEKQPSNTNLGSHLALATLVEVMKQRVIEIGTFTGLLALSMLTTLPTNSRLLTFDIVPWEWFHDTHLTQSDFASGRLTQHVGDVSDPLAFEIVASEFQAADLIFIDGPKDGRFERVLLERLNSIELSQGPLVVFDDIRVWNMLSIWRDIPHPKLDLTSFGLWSGTGLVDWPKTSA